MPYQAEADVTLPRPIGSRINPNSGERIELKESVNYKAGAIILEKDLTPGIRRRLDEGTDDHLSSLLRYVDASEARQILNQQVQAVASQSTPEGEILHQEERLGGGGPEAGPQFETTDPGYEAPPADSGQQISESGAESEENPPSADPESQKVEEDIEQGSSESTGEGDAEVVEETPAEASEDSPEEQKVEQDQTSESQVNQPAEEADKFEGMTFDQLKDYAKETKLSGRSKLKHEDELRAALRKAESE